MAYLNQLSFIGKGQIVRRLPAFDRLKKERDPTAHRETQAREKGQERSSLLTMERLRSPRVIGPKDRIHQKKKGLPLKKIT